MIAKSTWFRARKYGGWGLTPTTWQGWIYLLIIILPIILIKNLNLPGNTLNLLTFGWVGFFSLDFIHILITLKKDEREKIHEAIAERNAMWFVIFALIAGLVYQSAAGIVKNNLDIDPVILVALFGAMIIKSATYFYLRNK